MSPKDYRRKFFFFLMSIHEQLRLLVQPRGPLSYEAVRLYLTESGYEKPGKGMKHLIETIKTSSNATSIVKDLKTAVELMKTTDVARKKPGPRPKHVKDYPTSSLQQEAEDQVIEDSINARLDEALALRGKTQAGDFRLKVKRLLDALDEEDAEDEPDLDHEHDIFAAK